MGLFDFFSKEGRQARLLKKATKKILNMYVQTQDRMYYADQLAVMGTHESISALLLRFTKFAPNSTTDLEEKQAAYNMLLNIGIDVIEPCKEYVHARHEAINWPLKVLGQLLSEQEVKKLIIELLSGMDTSYERNPEKKEQIILHAMDFRDKDIAQAIIPFANDDNETIRFVAVETLLKFSFKFTAEELVKRFVDEDSGRIIRKLAEGFADEKWSVKGHKAGVEKNLPEGFAITRNHTVTRRGAGPSTRE